MFKVLKEFKDIIQDHKHIKQKVDISRETNLSQVLAYIRFKIQMKQ